VVQDDGLLRQHLSKLAGGNATVASGSSCPPTPPPVPAPSRGKRGPEARERKDDKRRRNQEASAILPRDVILWSHQALGDSIMGRVVRQHNPSLRPTKSSGKHRRHPDILDPQLLPLYVRKVGGGGGALVQAVGRLTNQFHALGPCRRPLEDHFETGHYVCTPCGRYGPLKVATLK
jgi:hypothetical protein